MLFDADRGFNIAELVVAQHATHAIADADAEFAVLELVFFHHHTQVHHWPVVLLQGIIVDPVPERYGRVVLVHIPPIHMAQITDGTPEVLTHFRAVKLIRSSGGRARQMNEGAREARGEILLFLHADTTLPENALLEIGEALADSSVAAGSFSLEFDHPARFFRILSIFGRINHPFFTYGDQGLFLRASTFRRIGGFKEIPVMEDVEIQKRLRKIGRFIKLREPAVTSARRYLQNGPLWQHLTTTGVVLLYHLGVSPHFLGSRYYRNHRQGETR